MLDLAYWLAPQLAIALFGYQWLCWGMTRPDAIFTAVWDEHIHLIELAQGLHLTHLNGRLVSRLMMLTGLQITAKFGVFERPQMGVLSMGATPDA
jgi:hypothetical protein